MEAVFTSACFSLTAKVSHGTLYLVLIFVGMYFAAASRCALTKFSYSSFGVIFPEDLPRAMNDREEWRERVRDIRATSAI